MQKDRYLKDVVTEFLEKKMVFLGGPRQVGKTHLCLQFVKPPTVENPAYLNWDSPRVRAGLRRGELPEAPLVVLDEIHKFKAWRNLVKGFYDTRKNRQKFLITGSARLDYYRRGGDSLLGRFRYLRLHPLSVGELGIQSRSDLLQLLKLGGFPEPFLSGSEREWKLWRNERNARVVNDDIRDLESLREFSSIEHLMDMLPERVGSLLSIESLRQDLQNNFRTVDHWIQILERVYFCFRIQPWGPPKVRAIRKEKKLYLWDWSTVQNPGAQFENFVASHLLKYCHFLEDTQGDKMELRFIRNSEKREIDFLVLKNKKPLFAVETKTGEKQISPHILYFEKRLAQIPMFYQVHLGDKDVSTSEKSRILPFKTFSDEVGLV